MAERPALRFAGLLRHLRAEARLTQEELAQASGLSPRSVSDLERGVNRTARRDTALLLAGALGLAEPAASLFVAAARGRAPAAEVLAVIRGEVSAPAPEGSAPGRGAVWPGCPYLGLVPFEEQDARVYYGRAELVAQLVHYLRARLDGPGILLVTGESGVGKSSLLRAGLIPQLMASALGPGSDRWPRRVIRPTGNPLRELAMHLADAAGADPVSVYRSLSAAPNEAPMLVELAARTAIRRIPGTRSGAPADTASADTASADTAAATPPRLVLIVDQLEELFTAGEDTDAHRAEREAFLTALHAATTGSPGSQKLPPALVVAAVRADFLGRLIAYPPLKAALDAGPFTVGPMSEAELRLAITGPAAEADLAVEPALVEAVIAELRAGTADGLGSGVLPLTSQAMAATWERREGNQLTLRAYRRAGGVADAVNRSAQAAYEALTSWQKDAARLVFTQLTIITSDGQLARRRCSRHDLHSPGARVTADIDAVIDIFSERRLLVLGKDGAEISHEVLLYTWKQLRDWLGDNQLDRALYSQVVTDAHTWDINRRDSAYLYRPGRLATIDAAITRWANAPTHYPSLPATSTAFLGAAHHAARRAARRRRGVIGGLLALTLIAISAAGVAVQDAANAARQHAIALSRQLAVEGFAIASSDPITARRLAVAAWRVFPTDQAGSVMVALLTEQQQNGILPGDPSNFGVSGVAFSPDGKLLAAGYGEGTVRLWDPATGLAVGAPLPADTGTGSGVSGVAFSPDGKLLAASYGDGTVRVWNPAIGQTRRAPPVTVAATGGGATGLAFSPDGKLLAASYSDGIVRLWNPATGRGMGRALAADTSTAPGVKKMAFSPDGKLLASADTDGTVRLWNPATRRSVGAPLAADTGSGGSVNQVTFSPDGKLLASADTDGTVRLWNPANGHAVGASLPADTATGGSVNGVAFSPDGRLLASADADGTVRLWDPLTGRAVGAPHRAQTGAGPGVKGVAFSPDGKLLATADGDGTVRLWNPATGQAPGAPLQADAGPAPGVKGVAFSADGRLLASADADGTVRLWDPATGQAIGAPLLAEASQVPTVKGQAFSPDVRGVAFSRDGRLLASADADGTVRLWDPATGKGIGALLPAGTGPGPGVDGVAFSPDGKLFASANGTVRVWKTATGQPFRAPVPAGTGDLYGADGVAFSPDSKVLASADADGTVQLWDPATGQAIGAPLAADSGSASVNGVAFSPDGRLLASADADGTIRLWNPATGQATGTPIPANTSDSYGVNGVAFSPDGRLLASADADGTIRLWNPATGQATGASLPAAIGYGVNGVAFSPDGRLLASAGADGTVWLWRMPLFANPYAALCSDVGAPTKAIWARYAPADPQPSVCS